MEEDDDQDDNAPRPIQARAMAKDADDYADSPVRVRCVPHHPLARITLLRLYRLADPSSSHPLRTFLLIPYVVFLCHGHTWQASFVGAEAAGLPAQPARGKEGVAVHQEATAHERRKGNAGLP